MRDSVFKKQLTTVQKGNFARLLVRDWKHILESAVAIAKFVTTTLLRFDPLAADLLTTLVCVSTSKLRGEIFLIVIASVIILRSTALAFTAGLARRVERIETMNST